MLTRTQRDQRRQLVESYIARGFSISEIARRLGNTPQAVNRYLKRHNLRTQRARKLDQSAG